MCMSSREHRANIRRLRWSAEVVEPGTPKGQLYAGLTAAERVLALARLNRRSWGVGMPDGGTKLGARGDWPGEVFEIAQGG
jgi:hypothetical protein